MKPEKVIFISTYNIECGLATYTENLTQALAAHNCNLAVLANKVLPTYSDTGHGQCEYVRCWDRITCKFDGIKKEIEKHEPRIVHFQFEYGLFAADYESFLKFLEWLHGRNISIIITPHSIIKRPQYLARLAGILRPSFMWFHDVLSKIDAVIVHTNKMKEALMAWDYPESKIVIIPHGIEMGERISRVEARKELNLPLDKKIILSFGLIAYYKNLHENIRVIARLSKQFPNLYYLIAGFAQTGSSQANAIYANKLIKQINHHRNMSFNACFIPHGRIKYYLCSADIYLLNYAQTSASASGNACLSLTYGIPSIASRSNLLAGLTEDACLRVDVNAPQQVAAALIRLLTEPDLCERLRLKALEMAQARTWDKIADLHLQLYEKMSASAR